MKYSIKPKDRINVKLSSKYGKKRDCTEKSETKELKTTSKEQFKK